MGVTSIALARELALGERCSCAFSARSSRTGGSPIAAATTRRSIISPRSAEQQAFFDGSMPVDGAQPLLPVPVRVVSATLQASRVDGAAKAFDTLLARGALVKVGDRIYRGSQIAQIRARVESHLRQRASR